VNGEVSPQYCPSPTELKKYYKEVEEAEVVEEQEEVDAKEEERAESSEEGEETVE
jgi:hypothetical protein